MAGWANVRLARTSSIASPIDRGVIDEILIALRLARSGGVRYSRHDAQLAHLAIRFNGLMERSRVHAADARRGHWV